MLSITLLFSLKNTSWISLCIGTKASPFFLSGYIVIHCVVEHKLFNLSPISFQSIAVTNNTAMNNLVDMSFCKPASLPVG